MFAFLQISSLFNTNSSIYFLELINLNNWLLNFLFLSSTIFCVYKFGGFKLYFSVIMALIYTNPTILNLLVEDKYLIKALWIGTLNIHPPIFYLAFIFLFFKLYSYNFYSKQILNLSFRFNLIALFLTLILGGLWGLQSLTWGFFWVNDGIEWLLLMSILLFVYIYHKNKSFTNTKTFILFFFLIVTNLLFIRLNIISTRHSFLANYKSVYLVLVVYFYHIFILFDYLKLKSITKPDNYLEFILKVFIYFFLIKSFYLSLTLKYLFTYLVLIFINKPLNTGYVYKSKYLHIIVIVIFISWSISYTNYFVRFLYTFKFNDYFFIFFKTTSLFNTLLVNTTMPIILELVNFFVKWNFTSLQILLNNIYTLICLHIPSFSVIVAVTLLLLKSLNLDFYIKKKHIFKIRRHTKFNFIKFSSSNTNYVYSVKTCRIDLVSIRLFKKLLRRKFIKAKTRFFKPKYWLLLPPNYLLTQKSKNSRMGAGVGKFVRLTNLTYSGKSLIKTWYYTPVYLKFILNYLKYKLPHKFLLKIVKNKKKCKVT